MPFRLALGLVALFSVVSLLSLAASYVVTQRSFDQTMRADLRQDMAGFRAAPSAAALATLVEAEARETDPERLVLSYIAPNRRHFGNAMIGRDEDGYHIISASGENSQIRGRYLALTASLFGGQLTIARSRDEIDALGDVFTNILVLSLIPTILIALSGGLYLARRSARHVDQIGRTLEELTGGDLGARVGSTRGWSPDIVDIGKKLDEMARAQEASVTAMRQVSSDIAHDLKTPIQRVSVYLDEMSRKDLPAAEARDLLGKAKAELEGIASVFRGLLQISQIETGSPRSRFSEVDLGVLAQTFCEIYEPSANEASQSLSCKVDASSPVLVHGDRDLLGQVLANLIENALRHAGPGAQIKVTARHFDGRPGLSISDTGPGIPEAERDFVLRRLYRLDRSRTTPGNGLGLSLVASIVALHDAELALLGNDPGLRVEIIFPAPEWCSEPRPSPDTVPGTGLA